MLFCSKRHFTVEHNDCISALEHTVTSDTIFVYLLVCNCHEIGHLAMRAYSSCTQLLFLSKDALSKPTNKTPSNLLTLLNAT